VDLDGELVLEGELREDLDRLLVELEAVPAFVEAGIDAPARVLFSGPSGTGKTLVARWLAGKLGLPLAVVRIDQVVKSLMGETAATLAKVFESMAGSPAVLFLDEIDGLCESRTGRGEDVHREMARTTTSILQRLDGLPPQQIVIAATNLPERLDAALLRRLAVQVVFPLPSVQARTRMIEQWLARAPVTPEQIKFLAAETQGLAGAEVRARAMAFGRERVLAERARKDSAA
jgi:ATP-dependent 26S proteasome regulatory subunit